MTTDEQAIRDLVATWHRSTAKGDVDSVLTLMAEDVVFLVQGHPPMRGRSAFESGLRTLLAKNRIESESSIEEIAISGELAYCWSTLKVTVSPIAGGPSSIRSGPALSILRRVRDSTWVVVRDVNLLSAVT